MLKNAENIMYHLKLSQKHSKNVGYYRTNTISKEIYLTAMHLKKFEIIMYYVKWSQNRKKVTIIVQET